MPHKTERPASPLVAESDTEGFSLVPEALLSLFHEHLSKSAIIVLLALMRWQVSPNHYSRPAADIARVTHMSVGTVRNATSELLRTGVLDIVSSGYRGHTAVYRLAVKGKSVTDWLPKARGEADAEPP